MVIQDLHPRILVAPIHREPAKHELPVMRIAAAADFEVLGFPLEFAFRDREPLDVVDFARRSRTR